MLNSKYMFQVFIISIDQKNLSVPVSRNKSLCRANCIAKPLHRKRTLLCLKQYHPVVKVIFTNTEYSLKA